MFERFEKFERFERFARRTLLALLLSFVVCPLSSFAGLEFVRELSEADAGATLTSGLYTVPEQGLDLAAGPTTNGLSIATNAQVAIVILRGGALSVTGGAGVGTNGAGAGIYIPTNSTLYVWGDGHLVAIGGAGARGCSGDNFGKGSLSDLGGDHLQGRTAPGGDGGAGGGGAGAGIGGRGFNGAAGGLGARTLKDKDDSEFELSDVADDCNMSGANGETGNDSRPTGVALGALYALGSVTVAGLKGEAGDWGDFGFTDTSYNGEIAPRSSGNNYFYWVLRSSGGGGGMGGLAPEYGIGQGGSGGAGGGGGGSGGVAKLLGDQKWGEDQVAPLGGTGEGSEYREDWGEHEYEAEGGVLKTITGGHGGRAGSAYAPVMDEISNLKAYAMPKARIQGAAAVTRLSDIPEALKYTVSFVDPDGRLTSVPEPQTVILGDVLPSVSECYVKTGRAKFLLGWYDDRGVQYYGATGKPIISEFVEYGDVILHPEFFVTGVPFVRELSENDAGTTLTNGFYTVPTGTLELHAPTTNTCLSVGEGQTVVLRVAKGCGLEVYGGEATNRCGAGAGIYVPKSARLYVIGDGEMSVDGGKAAAGGAGGVYTPPVTNGFVAIDEQTYKFTGFTSAGGDGGFGGGGAGAGFGFGGGRGGLGGTGGASMEFDVWLDGGYVGSFHNLQGVDGQSAAAVPAYKLDASDLGLVHIIGAISVRATGGASAVGGTVDTSQDDNWGETTPIINHNDKYFSSTAARGGYGGGGAGGAGGQGFGFGGAGGGGGGGGGSGGVGANYHGRFDNIPEPTYSKDYIPIGGDGQGGEGLPDNPSSTGQTAGTSEPGKMQYPRFTGGSGGDGRASEETVVGEWPIYWTGTPEISGGASLVERAAPVGLTYTITFVNPAGEVGSVPASMTVVSGMPYADCDLAESTVPNEFLIGWFDQPGGKGTCYFNRTKAAMTAFPQTSDVTLYPYVAGIEKAEIGITVDGKTVPAGTASGNGWTCKNCVLTLDGSKDSYVLKGENAHGYLTVKVEGNTKITFESVKADFVTEPEGPGIISIAPGVAATLVFTGSNSLKTTLDGKAGIHCPAGASVTLVADGMGLDLPEHEKLGHYRIITHRMTETVHLTVSGGKGAAAIGGTAGVANGLSGNIVFKDISVFATGGEGAAAIGRGVLSDGHTTKECDELTISSGCSVRPLSDTGDAVPFVVDPSPHNEYDMKVWFYRYFDGRMTYRFWLPSGETEFGYENSSNEMSYKVKVLVDAYGKKTTGEW